MLPEPQLAGSPIGPLRIKDAAHFVKLHARPIAHVACAAPKGCRIPVTDLFRRHPVLEAQRPRALGSGSATHTERPRRSQHESCEGRIMKGVQTKEEIEALRKA
jgi:hypothetical protein